MSRWNFKNGTKHNFGLFSQKKRSLKIKLREINEKVIEEGMNAVDFYQ